MEEHESRMTALSSLDDWSEGLMQTVGGHGELVLDKFSRERLFHEAERLHLLGNTQDSLSLYMRCLCGLEERTTFPSLPRCLRALANLFLETENFTKAIQFVQAERLYYEAALLDAAALQHRMTEASAHGVQTSHFDPSGGAIGTYSLSEHKIRKTELFDRNTTGEAVDDTGLDNNPQMPHIAVSSPDWTRNTPVRQSAWRPVVAVILILVLLAMMILVLVLLSSLHGPVDWPLWFSISGAGIDDGGDSVKHQCDRADIASGRCTSSKGPGTSGATATNTHRSGRAPTLEQRGRPGMAAAPSARERLHALVPTLLTKWLQALSSVLGIH